MSDTESESASIPSPPPFSPPTPPPLRGGGVSNKKVSFTSPPPRNYSPVPSDYSAHTISDMEEEDDGLVEIPARPPYDNFDLPKESPSIPSPPPFSPPTPPPLRGGGVSNKKVSFTSPPPRNYSPVPSDYSAHTISDMEEEDDGHVDIPARPPYDNFDLPKEVSHRAAIPVPPPPPPLPPSNGGSKKVSFNNSSGGSSPVPSKHGSTSDDEDHHHLDRPSRPPPRPPTPPASRANFQHDPYDNFTLPTANHQPSHSRDPTPSPPASVHDDDVEILPEDNDDKPDMNGGAVNGGFARHSGDSETGEKRYSLKIPVEDSQVEVDIGDEVEEGMRNLGRETLFFPREPDKRIDFVLVFEDNVDEDKIRKRTRFEDNLKEEGLILEYRDKKDSVDGKSNFTLVHATWEALATGAELMNMQKKIKMPKNLQEELATCCQACCNPFSVGEPIIQEEDDYFTSGFSLAMIDTFDIDVNNKEDFFSNAERSLIVKEILDRTSYTEENEAMKIGINKLVRSGCYKAAFPLHEGPHKPIIDGKDDPWEGHDKDRARLYEAWARPGRFYCYQPLDLIRTYFGEKIGIYFAWLGFYTAMLIPASILGVAAFVYGVITLFTYEPVLEVCDKDGIGKTIMCPECDKRCSYWLLGDSCTYARLTYLFDNWATVAFAAFMSLWATVFLEFWKRKQKELEYDWDVANFELEERLRPDYEMKVRHHKQNPITLADEPFMPWYQKVPRQCVSLTIVIFFMCLVVAAIFGVIIYRIVVVALLYTVEPNETIAKLGTSVSASIINLIIIMILNLLYKKVAWLLTELERPRTDTEFEDSFTFKMFLFQFVNFYGSIFYIAFFKGRFSEIPGLKRNYLFGFRQDTCDPSGCLVDLFIQLAIVMVGKQFINNSKEIMVPLMVAFCRVKDNKKKETENNLYMRWEQDNDLPMAGDLGLFEEYLEMVIQYGFVTIFVAAFPLAPLFALLNNVIEIRLDAYKFVKAWRRAPATKAQDIGVWFGILQSITFIAVLSNAFIIGWTSDFIPKMYYYFKTSPDQNLSGYVNNSLAYFATKDFDDDTRPDNAKADTFGNITYCRFKGYIEHPSATPPGGMPYDYTKEYWHIFATRLAFVLIFEHTVFLLTWIINVLIPDTPGSVKRLLLYERHLNKKTKFDAAFKDKGRLKDIAGNLLDRRQVQGFL